ncbi:MAG: FecR domain-containing protein [Verrucomicrobia bacterium]|nr:FecR domain-containing protein [Verrucomicrobiota bacterium]
MKRPEPDSPEARHRAAAAAEWLVRRDRGLTPAEQDAFLDWLAADPRHGEWLALHRGTVADFTALATWRPEHSAEPNPDLLARPPARSAPPPRKIHWLVPTTLAAAAAITLAAVWWRATPAAPTPAPVAGVDLKRRILEDGSSVELNHGAAVTTAFTATERRAILVSGEAYFTVAKNPSRPFIVNARGVDVRAVGTAFSVRLDAAAVEVLVTEGRVAVSEVERVAPNALAPDTEPKPARWGQRAPPSEVAAGHRATVSLTTTAPPQIVPVSPQAIAQQLSWQPQLLDFSSAPLSAAVAEFNRRNRVQFLLADESLAALPIIASIRSDNIEGFANFLSAAPGIEIERRSATEIVVRRRR